MSIARYTRAGSPNRLAALLEHLTPYGPCSGRALSSSAPTQGVQGAQHVALNTLADNEGATHQRRRVGRGIGSSKGKTAGRGHKGQKARSGGGPKLGFEGGQTPMRLRIPKRGFHNPFSREYQPLNLARLQEWITSGRLDASKVITMKDLRDASVVRRNIRDGVKLLAKGEDEFALDNVKLEVSQVSKAAKEALERRGGNVTTVYYNKLALRALTKPEWFAKKGREVPRSARPPPKLRAKFDQVGTYPMTQ